MAAGALLTLGTGGGSLLLAAARVVTAAGRAGVTVRSPADIVVPGVRLAPDGALPAHYRARLERAATLARAWPMATLTVLGGRTRAGQPSEAAAGAGYLEQIGVDRARIRAEEASRDTQENLERYILDLAARRPAALVSNRWHLARALAIARRLGLDVVPVAAEAWRRPTLRTAALAAAEALYLHQRWVAGWRGSLVDRRRAAGASSAPPPVREGPQLRQP